MPDQYPRLATMHYGKGYKLNPMVKHPSPALISASQIGLLTYESAEMKDRENRDALLITSYGTANLKSYEASTIATVEEIKKAIPGIKVLISFSSKMIRDIIKKDEGIDIPSPEQTLTALAMDGFTRVAIIPLNILPGLDYLQNVNTFNEYKEKFKKLVLATPLLYWMDQEDQRDDIADFANALRSEFHDPKDDEALLLMAHGTLHPSNSYYTLIQSRIDKMKWKNVFIYTMKGWPRIEHIIPVLSENKIKRVKISPLMLAAGSHATEDMSKNHRKILEESGFNVDVSLKGIGEFSSIRSLYKERALEAWYHMDI